MGILKGGFTLDSQEGVAPDWDYDEDIWKEIKLKLCRLFNVDDDTLVNILQKVYPTWDGRDLSFFLDMSCKYKHSSLYGLPLEAYKAMKIHILYNKHKQKGVYSDISNG